MGEGLGTTFALTFGADDGAVEFGADDGAAAFGAATHALAATSTAENTDTRKSPFIMRLTYLPVAG
jgi:hypothetical protein